MPSSATETLAVNTLRFLAVDAVEAASPFGWERYVGSCGRIVGIDHFGASAPAGILAEKFGVTVDAVVEAARAVLDRGQTI